MLKVKIEKDIYSFPTGWKDITIARYIEFQELLAKYGEETIKSFLDDEKDQTDFILFCADVVGFWGNIPNDRINKCDISDIYKAFNEMSKFFELPDINEDFKSFEFKGTEYHLPEKLMKGSTLIEFLEGMQIEKSASELEAGNWKALPKIISILARPEGEEYDSSKVELRSKHFMGLDMGIVNNIAFFLTKQNNILLNNLVSYLEEEAQTSNTSKLGVKNLMNHLVGILPLNK